MNFNDILREQLYALNSEYKIIVDDEQAFIKYKDLEPNTIYVLTRKLQNEIQIGIDSQPVQIYILSEQNSLDDAMNIFSLYAKTYNWKTLIVENDWLKQQYSEPVVMSNFNTIDYGYRSVLYMSSMLYIMHDVVDLKELTIDGESVTAITWDLSYNMSPNTQQLKEYIAKSVKSTSSLAITITIPSTVSALTEKVIKIMNETDSTSTDESDSLSYGGNENFYFDFYLNDYHFEDKVMKLVSADFGTAVNNAPAIRLGFMK